MICQNFQTAFQQKNDSILKGGIQVNDVFGFLGDKGSNQAFTKRLTCIREMRYKIKTVEGLSGLTQWKD